MSSLGRVQQVELIQGYNDMKDSLTEYLKKFAANGKVSGKNSARIIKLTHYHCLIA